MKTQATPKMLTPELSKHSAAVRIATQTYMTYTEALWALSRGMTEPQIELCCAAAARVGEHPIRVCIDFISLILNFDEGRHLVSNHD